MKFAGLSFIFVFIGGWAAFVTEPASAQSFIPTLDHPWLDEIKLPAATPEELERTSELVKLYESATAPLDAQSEYFLREWRRTLADPKYPAKIQAADKLARAAIGPRPRTCLVDFPDVRELRRVHLQQQLLKDKYQIDWQPGPLEQQLLDRPLRIQR